MWTNYLLLPEVYFRLSCLPGEVSEFSPRPLVDCDCHLSTAVKSTRLLPRVLSSPVGTMLSPQPLASTRWLSVKVFALVQAVCVPRVPCVGFRIWPQLTRALARRHLSISKDAFFNPTLWWRGDQPCLSPAPHLSSPCSCREVRRAVSSHCSVL